MQEWLLFAHVLAAMLWVGSVTVVGAFAVRVLRGDDDVGRFVASLRVIGPALLAPPPALLLAHQSRAALAAERAPDRATAARHLRHWAWGTAVIIVLLVAATWDMVFKPGL